MRARAVWVLGWLLLIHPMVAHAADASFRRIKDAAITKLFSGKEFSDDVHWSERYRANGTLEGAGMGRRFTKTWVVRDDMLCVADKISTETTLEDCREVWAKGNKVELRRDAEDELAKEGVVR